MEFLIVTGMSGAGKSTALKFLEDIGVFCIDNMPPALIPKFAELVFRPGTDVEKVALGVDIRGGRLFDELLPLLDCPESGLSGYSILFLDASDQVLHKRYKETRRKHPLSETDSITEGIQRERQRLAKIKGAADHIINTTYFLPRQLKEKINLLFLENKNFDSLTVTLLSFGFKYGIPSDSDLLFDVRFLPNPFYDPKMTSLTGNDAAVHDYVMNETATGEFLTKIADLLEFLIPQYINEGKNQLIISIGCTGGKHRSVVVANNLAAHLQQAGYFANTKHRDITTN
ncbi:MAG: RNase adapter RapZ [Defluviitaleaceae bacterium]|nr:RNase adapter RapZ [Defluviitaleaceae bacterium]